MGRWSGIDPYIRDHILIVCVGIFIFSPCMLDFFLSDDFIWISGGIDFSLSDLFYGADGSTYNIFRPLIPVVFSVLHRIFDLVPFGYHLSSIFLHIANALLFYHIILRLLFSKEIAVVSALLFVSHFAHEETLFWISSINVLNCWFLCLISILMFLNWLRDNRIWEYLVCLSSGLVAPLFREDALILLPILFGIVCLTFSSLNQNKTPQSRTKKTRLRAFFYLLPFVAMLFVYYYLRSHSLPHLRFFDLFSLNPSNLARNSLYFSINLTFPTRLVFDIVGYRYSRIINSEVNSIDSNALMVIACLLAICTAAVAFLRWMSKKDASIRLLFVILLFALLPLLFFKAYGLRFTYLPLLGFSPLAAHLLLSLVKKTNNHNLRLKQRCVWLFLVVILSLNFLILLERHIWWRKASITCKEIVTNAGSVLSSLPSGSRICFVDLPTRLHGAYIFKCGFAEAMSLFYPSHGYEIRTIDSEEVAGLKFEELTNWYWYRYENREFHRMFQPNLHKR